MARPFFVPETLQTSGMDCGPAAIKSLLAGLGVEVSYQRLRDACSTTADGTSIDALQDLCGAFGLEAYQELIQPADAVAALSLRAPAIVAVVGPGGAPHFVVVWRIAFGFVQLMDPGQGRVWVSRESFTRSLYLHAQPFDDESFSDWFSGSTWRALLDARLARLGSPRASLPTTASELTTLDGAARLVERLAARGAAPNGARGELIDNLIAADLAAPQEIVPEALTSRRQTPEGDFACLGAVYLTVKAPTGPITASESARTLLGSDGPGAVGNFLREVSPEALRLGAFLVVVAGILAMLAVAEMSFLRAAFNAQTLLALPEQRLAGTVSYGVLTLLVLVLELSLTDGLVRLGRALELRMHVALLRKLPRVPDRYFRTRPMSDVAYRSQGLSHVKIIPELFVVIGKQSLDLLVTVVAIVFLHPRGLLLALAALTFGVVVPYVALVLRRQVELRVQAHGSAATQLFLDVLFGLAPLKTHGAELAIRSIQSQLLFDWRSESERSVKLLVVAEALQSIGIVVVVVALVLDYLQVRDQRATLLLLAFWALRLPLQARALSASLQKVPGSTAAAGRLVEPLTAAEAPIEPYRSEAARIESGGLGLAVEVSGVNVVLGTQYVLRDVSLSIRSGEHVAIVGSSGAGKSSLIGVLLGVVERLSGEIKVDGVEIEQYGFGRVRREAVWIDPTVQVWNRSALHNLQFGNPAGARNPLKSVLEIADLEQLVARLPDGFASELGEGGARLSGGEGQRVRVARALVRKGSRLIALDEAFRGLDRTARRTLSRTIRANAGAATVVEVTHDVADTKDFDRIVVIENGVVVEDGPPATLLERTTNRYAALVLADTQSQRGVWDRGDWKRVVIEGGGFAVSEPDARGST